MVLMDCVFYIYIRVNVYLMNKLVIFIITYVYCLQMKSSAITREPLTACDKYIIKDVQ